MLLGFSTACSDSAATSEQRDRRQLIADVMADGAVQPLMNPQREEDFFALLRLFSTDRRPDERVVEIQFSTPDHAKLRFTDKGMHGGGGAEFERVGGKWKLIQKYWLM